MLQDESAWTDIGAPMTAANMISANELPSFIIVMPSEKDLSTPFGYVLANELVPYIDTHYRTIKDRRSRALGGLSRGASWAMFTVLRYPNVFGKMGLHSIGEFGQDEFKLWLTSVPNGLTPQIYIDVGRSDAARPGSEWLNKTLREGKIAHEFRLNDGDHNRTYWASQVKAYLRWYTANWSFN
jgi:enterochelin esterase-like enzyme